MATRKVSGICHGSPEAATSTIVGRGLPPAGHPFGSPPASFNPAHINKPSLQIKINIFIVSKEPISRDISQLTLFWAATVVLLVWNFGNDILGWYWGNQEKIFQIQMYQNTTENCSLWPPLSFLPKKLKPKSWIT